jgi:DNA-binding IclR family transcriptional regulator
MERADTALRTQAKSAQRAFDILEVLAEECDGLLFTDLIKRLELPKSSLHELLDVLAGRGYVVQDVESRRYALGVRVWELGQAFIQHRQLIRVAQPVMERIGHAINETVQLSILDGVENVYLAKVDCTHPVRLQSEVGKRLPAHATGLGKVLLAYLPAEERERRLRGRSLVRFTPSTIAELAPLEAELTAVRDRGFALDDQEYTPGLRCVAVPIRNYGGEVTAAISVSIPLIRAEAAQLARALQHLAEAALDISVRLGGRGDDPLLRGLAAQPMAGLASAVAADLDARRAKT